MRITHSGATNSLSAGLARNKNMKGTMVIWNMPVYRGSPCWVQPTVAIQTHGPSVDRYPDFFKCLFTHFERERERERAHAPVHEQGRGGERENLKQAFCLGLNPTNHEIIT